MSEPTLASHVVQVEVGEEGLGELVGWGKHRRTLPSGKGTAERVPPITSTPET